jgi:NADH-quinone oxidoreductase subunit L
MYLTFYGKERLDPHVARHAHESPRVMTMPLILLAAGSALVGYLGLPAWLGSNVFERFLEPAFETAHREVAVGTHFGHSTELLVTLVSIIAAAVGIYLAYRLFIRRPELPGALQQRFAGIHRVCFNKYYVDELYDALFVNRCKDLGAFLHRFDDRVVDGAVNGSALATRITAWLSGQADIHIVDRLVNIIAEVLDFFSATIRKLQTGLVQRYALFFILGVIVVIGVYLCYLGV